MDVPGLRLRHLVFHGPGRTPAAVAFGPGLNLIYGASETGKSFVLESIDFMLGGKGPLRQLPEREGYDRILLGLETTAGDQYTLSRSLEGTGFLAYSGLYTDPPAPDVEVTELSEIHNSEKSSNVSMFLLARCGLAGKRVRKNKANETVSLSFRHLARLIIVDETEITETRSPLSDGNKVADTPNYATFKLLLTGLDDTALVSTKPQTQEDHSREAQLELLDQLVDDYRVRLRELTKAPAKDLEDQLEKLDNTLLNQSEYLRVSERDYRAKADRRRDLRKKLEEGRDRRNEIAALLERFSLLDRHYTSDINRLKGIEEGGSLFEVLGKINCPLCGAEPANHRQDADCDGNVAAVVAAARSEIAKIELLRKELGVTIQSLQREARRFDVSLPKVEEELYTLSSEVEGLISPQLTKLRSSYAEFADKRAQVREALALYRNIQDIEERRTKLEATTDDPSEESASPGALQTSVSDGFAQYVEAILKLWHFPEADRVFFDPKARDLVISGKPRTARGKGLRAITHAAFTIGLLGYCRDNDHAHPGFVVLDSPLLSYRAPEEGTEPTTIEDDLSGTDLNERFYEFFVALPNDRQVIIIENTDPPVAVTTRPQVTMFSKNPKSGRYGLFPVTPKN